MQTSVKGDISWLEMNVELDHIFICVRRGAPEAEELVRFGLREGAPNAHPGQGTANRRFFFRNGMLELLWVDDMEEVRNEITAPTQLWERWSGRDGGACPFGILVRPVEAGAAGVPFASEEYRPTWLPADLRIHIAPAGVQEPMWVYMPFMRRSHYAERFEAHPNGSSEVTGLTFTTPQPLRSSAARTLTASSVLAVREGQDYLLAIELDHGSHGTERDFRPHLPLVLTR